MKIVDSAGFHRFCPKLWRHTHVITGDYVFDASIERNQNKDMRNKIGDHVATNATYGPKTGYNGYNGIAGDD
jgi:hypothetical protein